MKWGGVAEMWPSRSTHPKCGVLQAGRVSKPQRSFLRIKEGVQDSHWAPPAKWPVSGRGAATTFGFENQWGCIQKSWRAVGNLDCTCKGLTHRLTCPEPQRRGSSVKSSWIICEGDTLTNFRVTAGGVGALELFPAWKCYQAPFFLTCLPLSWPDASTCHSWHSPLNLLTPFALPLCSLEVPPCPGPF